MVDRPGQRHSISAASAVNSKGAFWFQTYPGALTGELFVELLKKPMYRRKKAVHLVVDGLPAHKKAVVKQYVASTNGRLTLHFLPGYAPELNPDELVWSHTKRTGVARRPLHKGEKLEQRRSVVSLQADFDRQGHRAECQPPGAVTCSHRRSSAVRNVLGMRMSLREHRFPSVDAGVVNWTSPRSTKESR